MTDLIAIAHGTADGEGLRTIYQLTRLMNHPNISLGFVDLVEPSLTDLARRVVIDGAGQGAVLVPLLLSSGYHVYVDIARAAADHGLRVARALGPDPVLAEVLADRLGDLTAIDEVVLAAAGSSDPRALADCQTMAELLSQRVDRPVRVGYVSGAGPRLPDVLTSRRTAIATYLLAPGFFTRLIHHHAAGRPVTQPLAPDPRIATLALQHYTELAESAVAEGG